MDWMPEFDNAIAALSASKDNWAQTSIDQRIVILNEIKDALMPVSKRWAQTAADKKLIPAGSVLVGEEWISGPYALMSACNGLIQTFSQIGDKKYLKNLPRRHLANGQLALKIYPNTHWDRLLLSGIEAEVWMQKDVDASNLEKNTASTYNSPLVQRSGKIALVMGAGNIAATAPLDCFQKLFIENQVVILKMNPVNEYMSEFLHLALRPLIELNALVIVKGDSAASAYLSSHREIDEIHITGSGTYHDELVWGIGAAGKANKRARIPVNTKRITSELGAVCPTIVVPGPWSAADIRFQAEHIATQKMHNSGYNCVACQMLILPKSWQKGYQLMKQVYEVISGADQRLDYYPGTRERLDEFAARAENVTIFERGDAPDCVVASFTQDTDSWFEKNEVFGPAMSIHRIDQDDPEDYLRAAVSYANDKLQGTLGANILIHPDTIIKIGKKKFEDIIIGLHYGCIAINCWSGLGFMLTKTPWGGFPGHRLDDIQSGIGSVHNTFMLENAERTIVNAPWRPFPRNLLSGDRALLARPPWFVTNRRQHKIGMLLTKFEYKPGWMKLPRIFLNALMG
jgi:acyl-CoA reductase-like NAD-dependent aldehyde dehydrogenase